MENAVNLSNWLSGGLLIASTGKQKCTKISKKTLIKNQSHLLYQIKYKTIVILSFLIGTERQVCLQNEIVSLVLHKIKIVGQLTEGRKICLDNFFTLFT